MDFMTALYPWLKSLHIVSVIAWMAALLYLPRLFVYHAGAEAGSAMSETFKVMEARLYKVIMTPAMIATWVFGLALAGIPGLVDWGSGYMWAKLALVLAMSGFHGFLGAARRKFSEDKNTRPARDYRILNEVPTVLMLIIVVLIVVRPF